LRAVLNSSKVSNPPKEEGRKNKNLSFPYSGLIISRTRPEKEKFFKNGLHKFRNMWEKIGEGEE